MPAMLILDRHRALDFLIATSMRAEVPEPFVRLQPEAALEEHHAVESPVLAEAAPQVEAAPALPAPVASAAPREGARERARLLAGLWRGARSPVAWSV